MSHKRVRPLRRLARREELDVCVVGAGIAGLSTAYFLANAGRKVVVVDDGRVGSGETSRTTAHLVSAMDDRIHKMEQWHGRKGTFQIVQSHQWAIEQIRKICSAEDIECGFQRVPGYLILGEDDTPATLTKEHTAARRAGLSVKRVPHVPLSEFDTGPALRFDSQGMFHPTKYLHGLADAIERLGGRIVAGVHVDDVEDGRPVQIRTGGGHRLTARDCVIATNPPITDIVSIHTKQAPYRTYAMAFAMGTAKVPDALLWDTGWPYHYIRTYSQGTKKYLIVGGEDHRTGLEAHPGDRHKALEAWTRERFQGLGETAYAWSGQVMETVDGAAFIGRDPGNTNHVWVHTGDSGQGMTHATVGGYILSDLIVGKRNPWTSVYAASRKTTRPIGEYLLENLKTNAQYFGLAKPGLGPSLDNVPVGEGVVVTRGLRKIAVYREGPRTFHAMSANCTHLGCPVAWNGLEKSWDCRCHGSRFGPRGRVLSGPANEPLKRWEGDVTHLPGARSRRNPTPEVGGSRAKANRKPVARGRT